MQEYNRTDQKVHYLSQVLAKLNRTFVSSKEDDSHTNLYFDPLSHRVLGRWIETDNGMIIGALNLKAFRFELINRSQSVLSEFEINGKTIKEIEQTIAETLSEIGLDSSGFRDDLHYEIPDYGFGNNSLNKWADKDIKLWESIRDLANNSSFKLLGTLQSASEVRIWPHHFDTGIYTEPNSKIGLGFGLAMKDEMAGDAYFYFAGYSLVGSVIQFEKAEPLQYGRWQIDEHWKGAILPVSDLTDSPIDAVQSFIVDVVDFYVR